MVKTTTKQKIGLILLGILLALVFLELFLRVGGFLIYSIKDSNNEIIRYVVEMNSEDEYRILCLGESTTENSGFSWPKQLQEILDTRSTEKKYRLFNEGRGGTNTALILSNLRKNIDKYQPDMIITMMGINDDWTKVYYKDSYEVKINLFFENIRIYRLSKLILLHLESKKHSSFLKESQDYVDLGWFYIFEKKDYIKSEQALKKAIELDSNNKFAYEALGTLYVIIYNIENNLTHLGKAEQALKKASKIKTNSDLYLISLTKIYEDAERYDDIRELLKDKGFIIKNISSEEKVEKENTKHHYQLLYNITEEEGIKLVVMQYPTRDINEFKVFFDEEQQKDIIFVSNEKNFEEAIKKECYDEYFVDRFALETGYNFGHCTLKGNRLIAENVAKIILEELNISN